MAQTTHPSPSTQLSFFQVVGKVEEISESSYTQQSTGEIVRRFQLTLTNPVMRDRITCEIALDDAPTTADMDRWELDESWVVISSASFRTMAFQRRNVRSGEKPVGAMVVFQATEIREATAEERAAILDARRAQKLRARQARAARRETLATSSSSGSSGSSGTSSADARPTGGAAAPTPANADDSSSAA